MAITKEQFEAQLAKSNKETVVATFKFHAVRNAEALMIAQSCTPDSTFNSVVSSALFDNPACGLVPASFLKALHKAFNDVMVVDAVEEVCSRLTFKDSKFIFV